jgi:hypothetical protein
MAMFIFPGSVDGERCFGGVVPRLVPLSLPSTPPLFPNLPIVGFYELDQ